MKRKRVHKHRNSFKKLTHYGRHNFNILVFVYGFEFVFSCQPWGCYEHVLGGVTIFRLLGLGLGKRLGLRLGLGLE
jgi:hypothetical protein